MSAIEMGDMRSLPTQLDVPDEDQIEVEADD